MPKLPTLYLSLHHTDGQSYDDEMSYDGYQRVELSDRNWVTRGNQGFNKRRIKFGKATQDYDKHALFIGLGTGKVVLMYQQIGGYAPYRIDIHKGSQPELPRNAFHIRPVK